MACFVANTGTARDAKSIEDSRLAVIHGENAQEEDWSKIQHATAAIF